MNVNQDLFSSLRPQTEEIREGVVLLRAYCSTPDLLKALKQVLSAAPLRHMSTPGGRKMSVAITNCGSVGWVSDCSGYRYTTHDPLSKKAWPVMPELLFELAKNAAFQVGFTEFEPDCCLINRYQTNASMGAHQDRDEQSFAHPIVSVSLGASAIFKLYGNKRGGRALNIRLDDGDVLVFGGASRLAFHGVGKCLLPGPDFMPDCRINLTFRRALDLIH